MENTSNELSARKIKLGPVVECNTICEPVINNNDQFCKPALDTIDETVNGVNDDYNIENEEYEDYEYDDDDIEEEEEERELTDDEDNDNVIEYDEDECEEEEDDDDNREDLYDDDDSEMDEC